MEEKKFVNKKIRRLEDIQAWIEARKFAKVVFEITKKLPAQEKFGITAHLNENVRHIPANIAEGFARFYVRDSVQFYRIALGSLNEIKSDTYLCSDRGYISIQELNSCLKQIDLVEKLLIGLANSAGKAKIKR